MSGPQPGFRITSLTAYTQIGPDDEEGVCAFLDRNGIWMPMVAADHERLAMLREIAQQTADATGQPVRVRRFTTVVEVETLEPRDAAATA